MKTLSFKDKLGFSVGEYSSSILWQTVMFFLPAFYTDTFLLPASTVAIMFLLVRIFDAVNDPFMGIISDRTNTRWGKFRPYLLWFAIPYGMAAFLMFTAPDFSPTGKVVYAFITYTAMMVIYTAIMIPYNSIIGVISPYQEERTSISSFKFVFAYAAGITVQILIIPMVEKFGAGNPVRGYQYTMLIFGIICVIFFLVSFFFAKEQVKPDPAIKPSVKKDLKDLSKNGPWVVLFAVSVASLTYIAIRSGVIIYYFKYFLGNEKAAGLFMASGTLAVLAGVLPTKWLSSKLGKKNLYIISMLIIAVSLCGFMLAGKNIALLYTFQIIFSLASGPTMPLLWSMLADAADFSEWKNKRRATGLVYSATTLGQKMGLAIGGAVTMGILSLFGYIANVDQSETSIMGIRLLMSFIPAAIALVVAVVLFFYKLDDKKVKTIEEDLTQRRKEREIRES
ncbi:MAG: MFS transporter [Bacteroidales bacterium]|nr:MFS transporter [Bacteroidales bacterium]